jgi:hypothetical protein
MAWRTSPPELVDLFERAVPQGRGIERRKMFGYPRTLAAWLAAALRYVRSLPPKQPKTARRDNTLRKKRSSR